MWTLVAGVLGWSWIIWVIVLVIIIVVIYLFIGGKNHRYVGLAPLAAPVAEDETGEDPISYIDPFTRERMMARAPVRTPHTYNNGPMQHMQGEITPMRYQTSGVTSSIHNRLYTFSPAIAPGVAVSVAGNLSQTGLPQTPGRRFDNQRHARSFDNSSTNGFAEGFANYQNNDIPSPITLRTPRYSHPIYVEPATTVANTNNSRSNREIRLTYTQMAAQDSTICTGITLPESYHIDFREMTSQDDSKGEFVCRCVLSQIYGVPFDKIRPDFLQREDSGRNLELDGAALNLPRRFVLNGEIIEYKGIAFEFSGEQHYVWPNFTGQPLQAFQRQVNNDQWKLDKCDREGYYVITIPYTVTEKTKSYELIPAWIEYYLLEAVIAREQARLRGEEIVTKPPAPLPKVIIKK